MQRILPCFFSLFLRERSYFISAIGRGMTEESRYPVSRVVQDVVGRQRQPATFVRFYSVKQIDIAEELSPKFESVQGI